MKYNRKSDVFWLLLPLAVGAISGFLTRGAAEIYALQIVKPSFSPPGVLFPIVWTVLYLLMGIGAAIVNRQSDERGKFGALNVFVIQLAVNFFWSFIFFKAGAYGFAFLWLLLLLALAAAMTVLFYRQNKTAGLIQIPYLVWLTFAAWLNYAVWILNR